MENGEKKKARGWKQFKRWEYAMQSQINPITGAFPKKTAQQVYDEYALSHSDPRSVDPALWTSLGPDNSNGGYSGVGRINCIAFHPNDLNTYWVGAAAGGLWVTTNNGNSWTCLTDNNGVLAVSNIIIPPDYASSHTIYIGTGDRESFDNRSIGVLKSIDDGLSWDPTGLTFSIFDNEMVNRILIDPNYNQTLIAATTNGVYKTTDGGVNWNTQLSPLEFIDMEFMPGNPNTIYGSTKDGRIFTSTNGVSFGLPVIEEDEARRIELAVSPNEPTWVYAVATNSNNGLYGIYKSESSGDSFALVFDGIEKNLLSYEADGSGNGGQGYYDLCIASSPLSAFTVVVGGINVWGDHEGGIFWNLLTHWYGDGAVEVHADQHSLTYRSNGDLFLCNDGGVYMSTDDGANWQDKTNGIVVSQMYKLGVSQTDESVIITGLQDNGTKIHSGNNWFDRIGGDGMECLVDYTDENIQYGTLYYGQIFRTDNLWQDNIDVTPPGEEGAWVTPYIIDPVNPEIIYAGYGEVFQSFDRGNNWFQISSFDFPSEELQSMAIASADSKVMYVSFGYDIWKTIDGGDHWTEVTNDLPYSYIRYIHVKYDDPNTVWVALSGYINPGIYETTDGGLTWTNISTGLPPIPTHTVVQNKLLTLETNLYAGTDLGVYFKKGDDAWIRYSDGLPNVIVNELEIYYAPNVKDSKLRAATYGRGLWETPIPFSSTPVSTPQFTTICNGNTVDLELFIFEGDIQWQYSPDGVGDWADVVDGTGANTENYTTGELSTTTFYRAYVSGPIADTLYSNITTITVLTTPEAAGPITGDTDVCQSQQDVMYSVDPIPNAVEYVWSFPMLVSGVTGTPEVTVDFGITPSGIITVYGKNDFCVGAASELAIEVTPRPGRPSIGVTVQPTCDVSTGKVTINNLPATGDWILTRTPDTTYLPGSGSSFVVTGLPPGVYFFTVTNALGCVSPKTISVIIQEHSSAPVTPVVTVLADVLHSDAPLGNQWYDENGAIAGATDQEYTAPATGNYYTIVTLDGCISDTSNVVFIDFTAVDPIDANSDIKVYPNPVRDELIIEVPGNSENVKFEILNSLGQVVYKGHITDKAVVKMSRYSVGIYMIKIEGKNGAWRVVKG